MCDVIRRKGYHFIVCPSNIPCINISLRVKLWVKGVSCRGWLWKGCDSSIMNFRDMGQFENLPYMHVNISFSLSDPPSPGQYLHEQQPLPFLWTTWSWLIEWWCWIPTYELPLDEFIPQNLISIVKGNGTFLKVTLTLIFGLNSYWQNGKIGKSCESQNETTRHNPWDRVSEKNKTNLSIWIPGFVRIFGDMLDQFS